MYERMITHVVANVDEEASGPSYSVPSLVAALNANSCEAELATVSTKGLTSLRGAPVRSFKADKVWPSPLKRLGRSKTLRDYLFESPGRVFHAHGIWMMSTIYAALAAQSAGKPIILAPRGMLGREVLGFSRNKKSLFGIAYQNRALEKISCFHATAESEIEDIRAFGLKQPIALLPNGIELPELAIEETPKPGSPPYILSLGRIHPKKALDQLVSAFAAISQEFPEWRLRLVGPSQLGYAEQLIDQANSLAVGDRVSIEPPVFGKAKVRLMQAAEVFALSTLHENFALTVAESLAVETPVISTKGAPWAQLNSRKCGWWIDHGSDAMSAALRQALSLRPEKRAAMGKRGRAWMQQDFGWDNIAAKAEQTYAWLLGDGKCPDFVSF